MLTVNERTFAATVLDAAQPVVVLFASRACAASRALRPLLAQLLDGDDQRIRVATVNVEQSPLLVEQYIITATPTLLIVEGGEVLTRIVGFVPTGLLQVLADQLRQGRLPREIYWRPLESLVEDVVILPLLREAGLHYQRQVACALPAGDPRKRGRIDVLISEQPQTPPFTLIESKRLLRNERDLQQAAAQAQTYAESLGLASFIVAAPSGLWIYRRTGAQAFCEQALSALTIQQEPDMVVRALQRLARAQQQANGGWAGG